MMTEDQVNNAVEQMKTHVANSSSFKAGTGSCRYAASVGYREPSGSSGEIRGSGNCELEDSVLFSM
jgi:hypothetical protein